MLAVSAMPKPQTAIAGILRDRVLRGLRAGTLEPGARLPSARELVAEFGVDNRQILAAYKELADDGLVEIRERGGVYVQRHPDGAPTATVPVKWFSETIAEGIGRGISAFDLAECLRRLIETVRLRAFVISSTEDQVAGLCRELKEDFGLVAEGFTAKVLAEDGLHAPALRRTDIVIATSGHAEVGHRVADKYGKPCIVIDVRPDLVAGEWAMLLRHPVWAVVATSQFATMLEGFFANTKGNENLRILVYDRDDLSQIPLGAPTYVTHRVREALAGTSIRGRILPPARTISTESATAICEFIVRANASAQQAIRNARTESHAAPRRA
jgi:DNA-binding transcriptional regulator YhcF (GntR family)